MTWDEHSSWARLSIGLRQFFKHMHAIYPRQPWRGLLALDPSERLYRLGRLVAFNNIEGEHLWEILPHGRWPVPFLEAGGCLTILELQQVPSGAIYLSPEPLADELTDMTHCRWVAQEEYAGPLIQWDGEPCVASNVGRRQGSAAINRIEDLWQLPFKESHCFAAVRFLHPPWKGDPPLIQEIWLPMEGFEEPGDRDALLRKAVDSVSLLNPVEGASLHRLLSHHLASGRWLFLPPKLVEFPPPFEQSFAYASDYWNLKHPVTQAVLQCGAALLLSAMQRTLPEAQIGILRDHLEALFEAAESLRWQLDPQVCCERFCDGLHHALSLAHEIRLFAPGKIEGLVVTPSEFVPGSIGMGAFEKQARNLRDTSTGQPFGTPLT